MSRRGLRLSLQQLIRTMSQKPTKTAAHLMAEYTLRELIAARFAVGKPVIHIDANWNDALNSVRHAAFFHGRSNGCL